MAAVNSNVSNINNEGEHIEDVISYLKEASQVLGDLASIAGALRVQIPEPHSNVYNLVDAIWRLAMDAENVSEYQLEEIERNGIRQETNRIQMAKETSHEN